MSYMQEDEKIKILRPFGPGIASTTIPKTLIDKINFFVDDAVSNEI